MRLSFCTIFMLVLGAVKVYAQGDWAWAKRPEVGSSSQAHSTATDQDGNVFVTGNYYSASVTFESVTLASAGYSDIYIVKYDSSGHVVWAKTFGSSLDERGLGIATDRQGNIVVTGYFSSPSVTFGNTTLISTDLNSAYSTSEFFIAKLDSSGNVIWAKSAAGPSGDEGVSIECDHDGNIYVGGNTNGGLSFNPTVKYTGTGYFLAKYDSNGNAIWVTGLGPSLSDTNGQNDITVDANNQIYLTGAFVDVHPDHLATTAFLAKFDSNGNVLWMKRFEGGGYFPYSFSTGVVADREGKVYITGAYHQSISFNGTTLFSPGSLGNMSSIFIVKFDEGGNIVWAQSATRGRGIARGIDIDQAGRIFITGSLFLFGLDRDTLNFGSIYLRSSVQSVSGDRVFLAQYDSNGEALWAWLVDSETSNGATSISTNSFGSVFVGGALNNNPNIPYEPGMGPINFGDIPISQSNSISMFIAKLRPCREPASVSKTATICPGESLVLTSSSLANNHWNTGDVSQSINVNAAGSYSVRVMSTAGCTLRLETTTVSIDSLPDAKVSASAVNFCKGEAVTLTSNSATNNMWSTGSTLSSISVTTPGIYYVTITDANNCKVTSEAVTLNQYPPLEDIQLFQDCNKVFVTTNLNVFWFKDGSSIDFATPDTKLISPGDSGQYYVEVRDQCSVVRSNIIHFTPFNGNDISQSNIITPNGDAYNEFFILDKRLAGSALKVVNRWGNEVFSSDNYQNNWNGSNVAEGVYFYIVRNRCFTDHLKGTLSILR